MKALEGETFYVTGFLPTAANHIVPHGMTLVAATMSEQNLSGALVETPIAFSAFIGALHATRPIFSRCEALVATPFGCGIFAPTPGSI